jgi:uncharacterized protein (DUF1330 family)
MTAYVIVEVSITDEEQYDRYRPLASASIAAHGGTYRVRGGAVESREGTAVAERVVVIEFPDVAQARRWYESDDYQAALELRQAAAQSRLFIGDGCEPG